MPGPVKHATEINLAWRQITGFCQMHESTYQLQRALSVALWMAGFAFAGWHIQHQTQSEKGPGYISVFAVFMFSGCLFYSLIWTMVPLVHLVRKYIYDIDAIVPTGLFSDATWSLFVRKNPKSPPEFLANSFVEDWPFTEFLKWVFSYNNGTAKENKQAWTASSDTFKSWANSGLHLIGLHIPLKREQATRVYRSKACSWAIIQQAIFNGGMLALWIVLLNSEDASTTSDYQRVTHNLERVRGITVWWIVFATSVAGGFMDAARTYGANETLKFGFGSRVRYSSYSLVIKALLALDITMLLDPATDLIWDRTGNNSSSMVTVFVVVNSLLGVLTFAFWSRYAAHHETRHDLVFAHLDFPATLSLVAMIAWCMTSRLRMAYGVTVADQAVTGDFVLQLSYAIGGTIGAYGIPAEIDHTTDIDDCNKAEREMQDEQNAQDAERFGMKPWAGYGKETEDEDKHSSLSAWRLGKYTAADTHEVENLNPSGAHSFLAASLRM